MNRKILVCTRSADAGWMDQLLAAGIQVTHVTALTELESRFSHARPAGVVLELPTDGEELKQMPRLWRSLQEQHIPVWAVFADDPRHSALMEMLAIPQEQRIAAPIQPISLRQKLVIHTLRMDLLFLEQSISMRAKKAPQLESLPEFKSAMSGKFSVFRFPVFGFQMAVVVHESIEVEKVGSLAIEEAQKKIKTFVLYERKWHPLELNPEVGSKVSDEQMAALSPGVMIVEDSASERMVLDRILVGCGYTVVHASSGADALKLIQKNRNIRLVFVNLELPEMDGFQLMSLFERHGISSQLRVCLLTSNNQKKLIEKAFALGARDFILKPIDPDTVVDKLSKLLNPLMSRQAA